MTDYSNYNEFLAGKARPNSYWLNKKKENDALQPTNIKKRKNIHATKKVKNSMVFTKINNPKIKPNDIISLLYINENITRTYVIKNNYLNKEPRFNDNPKSNRGTKEFQLVPQNYINDNEISTLSDIYQLIKYKDIGYIFSYNGELIKIKNIIKNSTK